MSEINSHENEPLVSALLPFFFSDWTDEKGWTEDACKNDRICDWFGPSDFQNVKLLLLELTKLKSKP